MPRRKGCLMHLGDFANMLKAFMGSAFLGVGFAFSKSGLVLGAVGVLVIASLTDHCCHLIIKVKYYVINQIMTEYESGNNIQQHESSGYNTESESYPGKTGNDSQPSPADTNSRGDLRQSLEQHMIKHISYGDVGKLSCGKLGLSLVNIFLATNQFSFCVAYFIFIGNTIHRLIPVTSCRNATESNTTLLPLSTSPESTVMPMITGEGTTSGNQTSDFSCVVKSVGPPLQLLVAIPLPIFLLFALIRTIRKMRWFSVIANSCILGSCAAIFIYIFVGFKIKPGFRLVNLEGVPVFFGMVTAAFEGIGLVIPVESSMDENRQSFSCILHGAIGLLGLVLSSFGIFGYMRFADHTQQMINLNLLPGTFVFYVVNISVCIGVLLTFPIQLYPVIELLEGLLFSEGSICGPQAVASPESESHDGRIEEPLLPELNPELQQAIRRLPISVAVHIPNTVSAWKRNVVRILLVLILAGLAVLFRDSFAYVGAFAGALGCSALGFVLPCVFHLRLCGNNLSKGIIVKDISIIIFGVVASVISVYYVVHSLISNTNV